MKSQEFLDKLSTHLRNSIATSISISTSLDHKDVTIIHLLYGLASEKGSIAYDVLNKFKLNKQTIFTTLSLAPKDIQRSKNDSITTTIPELDIIAKQSLEKAILIAYERSHKYVGTEHLLYGIASLKNSELIFDKFGVSLDTLIDNLDTYFQNAERFPEIEDVADMMDQIQDIANEGMNLPNDVLPEQKKIKKRRKKKQKQETALTTFAVDLTDKYIQAGIDPVIGRKAEITRLMQILCRRTKNNPVLVGEPGVGKTAIVEGLAKMIAEGKVPDVLKRKKILSLDLTLMIAGTIYRGEFEARLKQVIQEIEHSPDVIVFIDELHSIIGAGSNQGTMDAANILKPALARGTLRCIGATTHDEYVKYISSDPALERRFQSIIVDEPSRDEAVEILNGLKPYYESFHKVIIEPETIETAVDMSIRYVHDNHLPDKAIDLLDEASAAKTLVRKQSISEKKHQNLIDKLEDVIEKKEKAISLENFDDATEWKGKEVKLKKRIEKFEKTLDESEPEEISDVVTVENIAEVIGNKLSISADVLMKNTWEKLDDLTSNLSKKVIGQDKVINHLVKSLRRSHLNINKKSRPLASLLFVGPSGVGKTTLALELAKTLYHTDKALIRLDMSEFSESHGTSKLLGSPAGYVGHGERNLFTEQISKRPHSVILFDEIDKAHPNVRKLLLQILDDGLLTDSKGKKIHFNQSIIILTSNIGAELFKSSGIGFGRQSGKQDETAMEEQKKAVEGKLKQELGSALMSRVQSTCLFSPLAKEHLEQIISLHVKMLSKHLKNTHAVSIGLSKPALNALVAQLHNDDTGARHIESSMDEIIHELVVDILGKKKKKKKYMLKKKDGVFELV